MFFLSNSRVDKTKKPIRKNNQKEGDEIKIDSNEEENVQKVLNYAHNSKIDPIQWIILYDNLKEVAKKIRDKRQNN